MKEFVHRLLSLGFACATLLLLSGCYYDPSAATYTSPSYGGGYPGGNNSDAYNRGVGYGRQDSRRGLARQASRHWYVVPSASRGTFAQGYNAGYQQRGGGGGGQNPGQNAYSQGLSYGAADARRGLARQASRHWDRAQPAYRQNFAQGYNAGYVRN